MSKNISIRAFAKSMGVSHVAVLKAIRDGRIEKNKNGTIDLKKATLAWEQNTDLSKKREPAPEEPEYEEDPQDAKERAESARASKAYSVARAVKEEFAARTARLDFELKAKSLVMSEDVKMKAFQAGRIVRDTFLNLPNKISHELAAEIDPDKIHAKLTLAIHAALEMLFEQGKDVVDEEDDD